MGIWLLFHRVEDNEIDNLLKNPETLEAFLHLPHSNYKDYWDAKNSKQPSESDGNNEDEFDEQELDLDKSFDPISYLLTGKVSDELADEEDQEDDDEQDKKKRKTDGKAEKEQNEEQKKKKEESVLGFIWKGGSDISNEEISSYGHPRAFHNAKVKVSVEKHQLIVDQLIAKHLSGISEEQLKKRWNPSEMDKKGVMFHFNMSDQDGDWEYIFQHFNNLKEWMNRAANSGAGFIMRLS